MRLRILAGLLGLGMALGALVGLNAAPPSSTQADPLVDDYVRLVSLLYAKGESLATVEAWLDRVDSGNKVQLVQQVARRSGGGEQTVAAGSDLSGILLAMAPKLEPAAIPTARIVASGRGAGPTPTPLPDAVVLAASTTSAGSTVEYPKNGRISPAKGDAVLRAQPSLASPGIRQVARGTDLVLLGIERGQVVEGAEERWYKVKVGDSTGYVYFTLVETTQ